METRLSILFYGKKAKITKQGLMPIYLRVTIAGERFEVSTHKYVLPEKWLVAANRVKGSSQEARTINTFLDTLLGRVYAFQQEIIQEGKPLTLEVFCKKWSGEKQNTAMLLEAFAQHNMQLKELIGNGYAPATLTKYKTTLEYIIQFIDWKYKARDLNLTELNYEFISDLEFWLKSQKKCAHNTTIKYLINLKKVVLIAVKKGLIPKDPFAGYKMSRETVNRDALTEQELKTIITKDFKNERLN